MMKSLLAAPENHAKTALMLLHYYVINVWGAVLILSMSVRIAPDAAPLGCITMVPRFIVNTPNLKMKVLVWAGNFTTIQMYGVR